MSKPTKCDRCQHEVPAIDTFKAWSTTVCQGCYRLYTHGNTRMVPPDGTNNFKLRDEQAVYVPEERNRWQYSG